MPGPLVGVDRIVHGSAGGRQHGRRHIVGRDRAAGPETTATTATTTAATTATTNATECVSEIPDETGGPYPGDGTNGVNVLTEDGIVRSDITSSFGSSTTTTDGIPMELVLTIQDAASCTPVEGAAVYLWHCTAAGEYSLYSDTVVDENFLRGVQESDTNGQVRFTTIVPGCYDGRWPHMHFEIFSALSDAISGNKSIKTTQLAIPAAISEAVYSDARYPRSADNLARVSLTSDMVFADDGGAQQLASMSGDNAAGYRGAAHGRHLTGRTLGCLTGNSQEAMSC